MVFQGLSFFAVALVSVGVVAYHFYKNRESYFYDSTYENACPSSLSCPASQEDTGVIRRRVATKTDSGSICSICIESTSGRLTTLPCNHTFHKKCLRRWLIQNNTCPNCRAEIDSNL